jgi:hypothetical protein
VEPPKYREESKVVFGSRQDKIVLCHFFLIKQSHDSLFGCRDKIIPILGLVREMKMKRMNGGAKEERVGPPIYEGRECPGF